MGTAHGRLQLPVTMSAPWPRPNPFVVHKFGGTSVGTPEAITSVVSIVETAINKGGDSVAVVVSAMGGKPKVTDMLLDLVTMASQGRTDEYRARLNDIEKKHMDTIEVHTRGRTSAPGVRSGLTSPRTHRRMTVVNRCVCSFRSCPFRRCCRHSTGTACARTSQRTLMGCGTCCVRWS
jgi:hypothetical protein